MDGCDERWMENMREQTGEDLDPIWLTIHTHILRFFTILIVTWTHAHVSARMHIHT
jgi:hypothetical protein